MRRESVEDIYTLSPMQLGMLFDMLAAGDAGMYLGQSLYLVQGALDIPRFQKTWQSVLDRHAALRTAFLWEELDKPVQVVSRSVELPFVVIDWRDMPAEVQQLRLAALLDADRAKSFDLSKPPLMRLTLIRTGADACQLLWTSSHLIIDGWSEYIVLRDVFARCASDENCDGKPEATYRDYIAWLKRRDRSAAQRFWREMLAGFRQPATLTNRESPALSPPKGQPKSQERVEVPPAAASRLNSLARQHQLTLNTIVQGAWALLVSHSANTRDVVFGCVFSGRPPELRDVESIVGLFVNTLPIRIPIRPQDSLVPWLHSIQRLLANIREFENTPLTEIRRFSEVPYGTSLFESVVAFMKPWSVSNRHPGAPGIQAQDYMTNSSFPLVVKVVPGSGLGLEFYYDPDLFQTSQVRKMLVRFRAVLEQMAAGFDAPLQSYLDRLGREDEESSEAEAEERRNITLSRFRRARPKPLTTSNAELIETGFLDSGETRLPVIRPAVYGLNLNGWANHNRNSLEQQLLTFGGVLLRGFPVNDVDCLEQFVQSVSDELLEYRFRASPRTQMGNRIYSSTDYPAEESIFPHHEHAFCPTFPLRIYFCCLTAARQGGETPIGNARAIFRHLNPGIRKRFSERRVMYVRNYGDGFGLPWSEVFGTSDRGKVEDYCRGEGITCEWKDGNRLRTRYVGQALSLHPKTGEQLWFNHATFFHVTTLPKIIREKLLAEFREEDLPNNTYYGDGSPIEADVLEELRSLYERDSLIFPWQKGDILLLDNMLSVHGRRPYVGPRKVVVGMAEPVAQRR